MTLRIVPVEATEEMEEAHWRTQDWPAMVAAAPDYANDETIVDRVARTLWEHRYGGLTRYWEDVDFKHPWITEARAVLALFGGRPDE